MRNESKPSAGRRGRAGAGPGAFARALTACLALVLIGALLVSIAHSATVSNLNNAGAGSLRAALSAINATDTSIVFDPGLSGNIPLNSTLPSSAYNISFINAEDISVTLSGTTSAISGLTVASGRTVTGALPGVSVNTTSGAARGLSGNGAMTLQSISGSVSATAQTGAAYGLYSMTGAVSITNGISGSISATSGGTGSAYGIQAQLNALTISSGGVSGSVSATAGGSGAAYGLYSATSSTFTLADGVSGSVSAKALGAGAAYGIYGGTMNITNHGVSGSISAEAASGAAYGIYSTKIMTLGGGIAGQVSATSSGAATAIYGLTGIAITGDISGTVNATSTGSGAATALLNSGGISTADISGVINATSATGTARGLYSSSSSFTTGALSGTISASGANAYGLFATASASSTGNISGSISSTSSANADFLYSPVADGIHVSGSGSLVTGNITGNITASTTGSSGAGFCPLARGLYSDGATLTTGDISGRITASSADGEAYGIYSKGLLTTGTISGTISASANTMAAAIVSAGGSNLTISGTLSATDTTGSGNAYAIQSKRYSDAFSSWEDTTFTDTVTLLSGARLLGKVDLSGGDDLLTLSGPNITISGQVDGGAGTDTLALAGSGSFGYSAINFERLTKSGSGTWTLDQNLDLGGTGATTVSGGSLNVNATLTSPSLSVASGASLAGTGTVIGNVTSQGTVSPGNSVGTLNITGNYTQASGSVLRIEVANSACDLLNVSGTATLNAGSALAVDVLLTPSYYASGQTFTFLKAAGGITGSFDNVAISNSNSFLTTSLAQSATEYSLVVSRLGYSSSATTANGLAAAQALDLAAVSPSSAMQTALALVDFTSASQAPTMLDQLGPAIYGAMSDTSFSTQRLFTRAARSQLFASGPSKADADGWAALPGEAINLLNPSNAANAVRLAVAGRLAESGPLGLEPANLLGAAGLQNVYLVPLGTYTLQRSHSGSTGYEGLTYGLAAGVLIPLDERFGMAVQFGYAHSDITFLSPSISTAEADHIEAGVFGTYAEGGSYGVANIQAGLTYNSMHRRIDFGTSQLTANGHPITYTLGTGIDLGRDYELGRGLWAGPVGGLQYARFANSAFTEAGAGGLNLSVNGDTAHSLKSTLGGRVRAEYEITPGGRLSPEISLRWAHEFLNDSRSINAAYLGAPGISFAGVTSAPDSDALLVNAEISFKPKDEPTYFLKYNAELSGEERQTHSLLMGVNWTF